MKRVVVASTNPVKLNAVRLAFQKLMPDEEFEWHQKNVASGVSKQPSTDLEKIGRASCRERV